MADAGGEMVPEFGAEQDFSSEPLESRLGSKDLNRRCSAYTELSGLMSAGSDGAAAAFQLFKTSIDICLAENLPKGQDSALSALSVYLERCPDVVGADVLPLVRRLIEHKSVDKPKMQQLVPPLVVLITELNECSAVVGDITACLTDLENAKKKTQGFFKKQVALVFRLLHQLLSDFGPVKMHHKLGYLNLTVKYVTDSDRNIREACYSVLLEHACWTGAIPDAVKSMEEPQKKEVAKRLEGLSDEEKVRGEPRRRYRSEKGAEGETAEGGGGAGGGKASKPLDKFDLVEASDALKRLPKGWCIEKVFSMEKWKEKQVHLQVLTSLVDSHRLQPSEGYAALVPSLQRILKTESNLPVVTEAAKCVGLMARGLRKEFERPAKQLLPVALARINDKSVWKPSILIEPVEQLLWSVPFEFLLDEIQTYAVSKSIFVKKEAIGLLLRTLDLPSVRQACPDVAQRFLAPLASIVLPVLEDSDNSVRHEAAKFLASLVFANLASAEVGPVVLDRIPAHRSNVFEEEWRKIAKDEPCPLATARAEGRSREPVTHASTSRSASALRPRSGSQHPSGEAGEGNAPGVRGSRPTSPLRVPTPRGGARHASPLQRPGAATARMMESPSKLGQASPRRVRPQSPGAGGYQRSAVPMRARSASTDRSGGVDPKLADSMREMAEEIKHLRSTVTQLQKDKETPGAAAAAGQAAPPAAPSRPRTQNSGLQTPRAAAPCDAPSPRPAAAGGMRPATPPRRPQSWDHAPGGRAADSPAPRRLSSASSSCAPSPVPAQRAGSHGPAALGANERGLTRTSSADLTSSRLPRRPSRDNLAPATRQREASGGPSAAAAALPTSARALVLTFELGEPRIPKTNRQARERCQYWGPEPIPAEHLQGMKEVWKQCVDERVFRAMFSEKMEEQLAALQSWKFKVQEQSCNIEHVLDLLLKWLTYLLMNANTQIWKAIVEVLGCILSQVEASGAQLSDREAQILMPNLLERSGHNIAAIRESMEALLKLVLAVHPRLKLLPMLLQGLLSKNKRSVACAMRCLAEAQDRQVAAALVRSQKDLTVILKALDDKDADVRKSAVHAVASLALHVDNQTFGRILKPVPASTQQVVRSAAARLSSAPSAEASPRPGHTALSRSRSGQSLPSGAAAAAAQAPQAGAAGGLATPAPVAAKRRAASEGLRQDHPEDSPAGPTLHRRSSPSYCSTPSESASPSLGAGVSPIPPSSAAGPSPSPGQAAEGAVGSVCNAGMPMEERLENATSGELAQRLPCCPSSEEFRICCNMLKERMKSLREADSAPLAESLVAAMRMYLGHDRFPDRCKPLVDVLEEFCASKEGLKPLSIELLRGLLREQLRNLHDSSWTRQMDIAVGNGQALLRTVNLSCVMLLNNITRSKAISLLLELGTEESEIIPSSLVVKCLRKVTKNLGSGRDNQLEILTILDAAGTWLRRAQPRLSQLPLPATAGGGGAAAAAAGGAASCGGGGVAARSLVDAAVCSLLDGVREVVDLSLLANPETTAAWAQRLRPEERRLLQGCQPPIGVGGGSTAAAADKENALPADAAAAAAARAKVADGKAASSPTAGGGAAAQASPLAPAAAR